MTEDRVAVSRIDRELLASDLARAQGYLLPLMLARFEVLREVVMPIGMGPFKRDVPVGRLLLDRLKDFLPQTISDASEAIAGLSDDELYGLASVIAGELGAWCRAIPALSDDQVAEALPAMGHLLGLASSAGDEPPDVAPVDLASARARA